MKTVLRRLALCGALLVGLIGPAAADSPVVVELFTSQGCSSCPPADEVLSALARRDDVIALGLHVDYWDYLGWKDTMGKPAHTARQKSYAHVAGSRSIYTPQMIVGGTAHVIGHKPMKLSEAIAKAARQDLGLEVTLKRSGNQLHISVPAMNGLPGEIHVQVVRYEPVYKVQIRRGENAGKTITYVNAVTDLRNIASWNGRGALTLSHRISGNQPVVVLLQQPGPGRILGAAQLR